MSGKMKAMVLAGLLCWSAQSWAGELEVHSAGVPVVVMRGNTVVGTTPLTLKDLPAGSLELGFRESTLGSTLFTQKVNIPASGLVSLEVNLTERTATLAAPPPPPPTTPVAPPPVPTGPAGDVYVASTCRGPYLAGRKGYRAGCTLYVEGRKRRKT